MELVKVIFLFVMIQCVFGTVQCDGDDVFAQLVTGLKLSSYEVETEDNYVLKLFRTHSEAYSEEKEHHVVLFVHALTDSSNSFVYDQDNSLAIELSKQGHDVWYINNRGNKYSCYNTRISNETDEFWQFSFQEMGEYDLPTTLRFINQKTNKKITVIGYSQGTTQMFVSFAAYPELQKLIHKAIYLGPSAFMLKSKDVSPLISLAMKAGVFDYLTKKHVDYILTGPSINNNTMENVMHKICVQTTWLCKIFMRLVSDRYPDEDDTVEFYKYLHSSTSRASVQSWMHYQQMFYSNSTTMYKFDYGSEINIKKYGQKTPPSYDLTKIDIPSYLYHGDGDLLANMKSTLALKTILKKPIARLFHKWGHLTFILSKRLDLLNKTIIEEINNTLPQEDIELN